jgi:hypothetical protein
MFSHPVDTGSLNTIVLGIIALFAGLTVWQQQRIAGKEAARADKIKETLADTDSKSISKIDAVRDAIEKAGVESSTRLDSLKSALEKAQVESTAKLDAIARVADETSRSVEEILRQKK